MDVRYEIKGQSFQFTSSESEDLRNLIIEVTSHLSALHEELSDNPELSVLVSNGVLNSLSDNTEDIDLGELAMDVETEDLDDALWEDQDG